MAAKLRAENAVLRRLSQEASIDLTWFPRFVVVAPSKEWVSFYLFHDSDRVSVHSTSCMADAPGYVLSDVRKRGNILEAQGVHRPHRHRVMPERVSVVAVAEEYDGMHRLNDVLVPRFAGSIEIRSAVNPAAGEAAGRPEK